VRLFSHTVNNSASIVAHLLLILFLLSWIFKHSLCNQNVGVKLAWNTKNLQSLIHFKFSVTAKSELQNLLQILHLYDLSLWGLCTLWLFQVLVQIYAVNSIC